MDKTGNEASQNRIMIGDYNEGGDNYLLGVQYCFRLLKELRRRNEKRPIRIIFSNNGPNSYVTFHIIREEELSYFGDGDLDDFKLEGIMTLTSNLELQ